MAAGVPIVASQIPVFEEVLGPDGECARLFSCGSSADLAESIAATFKDATVRQARCNRGLERVRSLYSAASMAMGYSTLYDQITDTAACKTTL
jgi:glycosyltransferase involved in cell wall biosynthesis